MSETKKVLLNVAAKND